LVADAYVVNFNPNGATAHRFYVGDVEAATFNVNGAQFRSGFPRLDLIDTDGATGFNRARMVQNGNALRFLTANNAGSMAYNDYLVFKGANGATRHEWYIDNQKKFEIAPLGGAVAVGAAGGDKGTGSLNAQALYVNGKPVLGSGAVAQIKYAQSTTSTDITNIIPHDNTIPQNNAGEEIVAVTITPTNASSTLIIEWGVHGSLSVNKTYQTAAIFVNTTADAIAAVAREMTSSKTEEVLVGSHGLSAGGIAARTYKVRTGPTAGIFYVNQARAGEELFSTVGPASWIKVTEVLP